MLLLLVVAFRNLFWFCLLHFNIPNGANRTQSANDRADLVRRTENIQIALPSGIVAGVGGCLFGIQQQQQRRCVRACVRIIHRHRIGAPARSNLISGSGHVVRRCWHHHGHTHTHTVDIAYRDALSLCV